MEGQVNDVTNKRGRRQEVDKNKKETVYPSWRECREWGMDKGNTVERNY